ncbi:MBL fold metallo-hydrolase [Bacteroides mediterraneensis]|uniref:MBL fold metallo-hydrolase n=1 Tax=Bacteroides mediterraneensis TaxID=1841856 RepID=A0ABS2ETR9_9BACE|nr:MBL fold metallo-hydrolase [Bacteroides mediterraneensis]MBM6758082.1 MBL fold metallo-hydrolase [Bacteroides mediterraneensis]
MKIKSFEFNMFPVNCYVVWDDETLQAAVIDAGCYYKEEQQTLKKFITDNQLTVVHLLNTHLHLDHVFGNAFMLREFGLSTEASEKDAFLLPRIGEYCRMFGFPLNEDPPAMGKSLADGDKVQIGQQELKVIAVPGHSPGGLVFYSESQQCIFSGDVLFRGSIGRADLEGGNFEQLRDGVMSRLLVLPDETIVYPGHGSTTTIGYEKMNNPFFR